MSDQDFRRYRPILENAKFIFKEGLIVFNQILFKLPSVDIILLCKINLTLAKFLEEMREFKTAVVNLRTCLEKVVQYRDEKVARGVESQSDVFLPICLTTNNKKIKQMVQKQRD